MVPALAPDFAFVHVQQADAQGNLLIHDPLYDEILIKASKTVIVSCEEIIDEIAEPTIPALYVDYLLEIPNGAKPTSCLGYYEHYEQEIQRLLKP